MADGTLIFNTKLDSKGLETGLQSIDDKLGKVQGVAVKAFAGIGAGLAGATVAGVKFNATIEQYETTFKVFTGSADKARETMQKLIDLGAKTPFETTDLADATQMLMSYQFTADEAVGSLTMLGDASQGNAEKLRTITEAFGRMRSSSKVTLDDINRMIDAGFNPLTQVAKDTGMTMAEVYEAISAGKLPVEAVTKAMQEMTSEGGQYYKLSETQAITLNGMLSTLSDTVQIKLEEATEALTEKIAEALPVIISFIDSLDVTQVINGLTKLMGTLAGIVAVITTIRGAIAVVNFANLVTEVGSLGGAIASVMGIAGTALAPILAIVAGITAFVGVVVYAYNTSEQFRQAVSDLASSIMNVLQPVIQSVIQVLNNIMPVIMQIIDLASQVLTIVISVVAQIIQIITPIIAFIADLVAKISAIIAPVISQIISWISSILDKATPIFNSIYSTVSSVFSKISSVVGTVVGTISNVIGTLSGVFNRVFNTIQGIVSTVMNTVGSIVSGVFNSIQSAWNGLTGFVSGVFSGIAGAVNSLVSTVKGFVNNVIGGINGAIGLINKIPGVKIRRIPYLAQGGVLKKGQVGLLEGSGAEAVVPLEKNKQWIRAVAKDMVKIMPSVGAGGGQTINFNQPVQSADQVARVLRLEQRYGLAGAR